MPHIRATAPRTTTTRCAASTVSSVKTVNSTAATRTWETGSLVEARTASCSWGMNVITLQLLDLGNHLRQALFGVAEEHGRLRVVEQLVLDPGESGGHGPLQHDDALRIVRVDDRHAEDRTRLVRPRGRVHHVVRAD